MKKIEVKATKELLGIIKNNELTAFKLVNYLVNDLKIAKSPIEDLMQVSLSQLEIDGRIPKACEFDKKKKMLVFTLE